MITVEFIPPDAKGLGAEAIEKLRPPLVDFVRDAMMSVENLMKVVVGRRGMGRAYRRGKKWHRASAPGQPPARDTGSYVNSWSHEVTEGKEVIEGRIGSLMWRTRGRWLEFGTRRMKPRPHAAPTIEIWQRDIEQKIARLNG